MDICPYCKKPITNSRKALTAHGNIICVSCVNRFYKFVQDKHLDNFDLEMEDIPTPKEIKDCLDKSVIGQERAKKVISVSVYNHYKRLLDQSCMIEKSNILMVGPTGCGKTHMIRTLAETLHVPFVIADATSLTETGYVGDDVESVLARLLKAADGNKEAAERGIVYIDEIDKISKRNGLNTTRDISGEGVQQALLKIIEGSEISVPVDGIHKTAGGATVMMDTSNILFICGGAFDGMLDLKEKGTFGFLPASVTNTKESESAKAELTPDVLVGYGLTPEFVGRLPVLVTLDAMDKKFLVRILTEPKTAVTKQYERLFEMDGVRLIFEKDALEEIAELSLKRNTGARGLRSILEDIMTDIMFEIPGDQSIKKVIITKDSVHSKVPLIRRNEKVKTQLKTG